MRVGLALAGGGASGGAHIGVLRALEEAGLNVYAISGTSSGSVVAGLYAAGITTAEMLQLLPKLNRSQMDVDMGVLARFLGRKDMRGLMRGDRLHEFVHRIVGDRLICDVGMPVAIIATDLQTGQEVVFASGECPAPMISIFGDECMLPLWKTLRDVPVATAIRASISIPFVFQPIALSNMILADGGLIDNCPVDPLRAMGAEFTIAVDTITPFLRLKGRLPLRVKTMTQQIINIGLARHAALGALKANVFLAPPVGPIGALDFSKLSEVAERGYEYTRRLIPTIIDSLEKNSTS